MVILCVGLEVLCEVVDAFTEDRHLHFGGSGVCVMRLVTANELRLAILGQRHLRTSTHAPVPQHRMRRMSEKSLVEQDQHVTTEQPRDAKARRQSPGGQSRPAARLDRAAGTDGIRESWPRIRFVSRVSSPE